MNGKFNSKVDIINGLFIYITLNIIENDLTNFSDYATALIMSDHLTCFSGSKCAGVLNMAQLYMQGLHRVLSMSEYGSICFSNMWVCFNVSQYYWTLLNIAECPWMYLKVSN